MHYTVDKSGTATLTITAKMSGTGTIHDVASEHYDRTIEIPEGHVAAIRAAYYGDLSTVEFFAVEAYKWLGGDSGIYVSNDGGVLSIVDLAVTETNDDGEPVDVDVLHINSIDLI